VKNPAPLEHALMLRIIRIIGCLALAKVSIYARDEILRWLRVTRVGSWLFRVRMTRVGCLFSFKRVRKVS
jgi:hypothetical protein